MTSVRNFRTYTIIPIIQSDTSIPDLCQRTKYSRYSELLIILEFQTHFSLLSNKMLVYQGLDLQNAFQSSKPKTLIRLHLQKQSDLGLPCLSRPFWQGFSVRNLRTYTIYPIIQSTIPDLCQRTHYRRYSKLLIIQKF